MKTGLQFKVNTSRWARFFTKEGRVVFLYAADDILLAGGAAYAFSPGCYSSVMVLPLAGAVQYGDDLIAAGQVLYLKTQPADQFLFRNPFAGEVINMLIIGIAQETLQEDKQVHSFDVNKFTNVLMQINNSPSTHGFKISIGKFKGRGETVYSMQPQNQLFLFVLQGAFEAAGRLLHERDALLLWSCSAAEMEALSNDAIIVALELPV